MTKANNDLEADKISPTKEWHGSAMRGEWDGTGWWSVDKHWKGLGKWQGGLLSGTWDGTGEWEPVGNGKGNWKGEGDLTSSMAFKKYAAFLFVVKGLAPVIIGVAVIGLAAIVARGLISNRLVIAGGFVAILLIFLLSVVIGKIETSKGKWWGYGTWEDEGDFRILHMNAKWKLGYHEGILSGKMKDHRPR